MTEKIKELIEINNEEGEVNDQHIANLNEAKEVDLQDELTLKSDIDLFSKLSKHNINKTDFDHLKIVLDVLSNDLDNHSEEVSLSYELLRSKL